MNSKILRHVTTRT